MDEPKIPPEVGDLICQFKTGGANLLGIVLSFRRMETSTSVFYRVQYWNVNAFRINSTDWYSWALAHWHIISKADKK